MISKRIDSFMATVQKNYWKGIEMLPVMHEYIEAELRDAQSQLATLVSMKKKQAQQGKQYSLEPFIAETIFSRYSDKIAQRYQIEKQCHEWRNISLLTQSQLGMIRELENNLTMLNKYSQQVLFYVEHFKQQEAGKHLRNFRRCYQTVSMALSA